MGLAREMSMEIDVTDDCGRVEGDSRARGLHEQLVRYVWQAGGARRECVVWREHSYARCVRSQRKGPRVLLAPVELSPRSADDLIDVDGECKSPLPPLPGDETLCVDDEDSMPVPEETETESGGWEARLPLCAPTSAHASLAQRLGELLAEFRLLRLAQPCTHTALRREQARKAASKFRRLLAPAWAWGGGPWAVGYLMANVEPPLKALLQELVREFQQSVPKLAARLPAGLLPQRAASPAPGPPVEDYSMGPLLLWVCEGGPHCSTRWPPRLSALLPTRVLCPPSHSPTPPAPPDQWCAAHAAAQRAALTDALNEAGSRPVVLVGFGLGAALAAALATAETGCVRGAALLAPRLLTAEGSGGLTDARVPLLLVCGTRTVGGKVAALDACDGNGGTGTARRLLLVSGADDALRVPARVRLRRRVPQHAIDAAIAEEVVRWAADITDADAEETDTAHETSGELDDEEEYAHLPPGAGSVAGAPAPAAAPAVTAPAPVPVALPPPLAASTPAHTPPPPVQTSVHTPTVSVMSISSPGNTGTGKRAIEIVEGRVVTRVSGSTPLMLAPRRPTPSTATGTPLAAPAHPAAPADIMQLPVVFADDDTASTPAPDTVTATPASVTVVDLTGPETSPITVTSGSGRRSGGSETSDQPPLKYTRVIVAKRGPQSTPSPQTSPQRPIVVRGGRGGRPLLLRRAVRVVERPRGRPPNER